MRSIGLLAVTVALAACGATDSETAGEALDGLSSAYEQLTDSIATESGEAVDWAREDIENLGDWEYRIVDLDSSIPAEMEAELNELGDERWEAYWIEQTSGGVRVYLKRNAFSLVSRVPLSALLRALSGGGSQ
jgi:hypothetical protein